MATVRNEAAACTYFLFFPAFVHNLMGGTSSNISLTDLITFHHSGASFCERYIPQKCWSYDTCADYRWQKNLLCPMWVSPGLPGRSTYLDFATLGQVYVVIFKLLQVLLRCLPLPPTSQVNGVPAARPHFYDHITRFFFSPLCLVMVKRQILPGRIHPAVVSP